MATIVKQIFGNKPAFLAIKNNLNIFELTLKDMSNITGSKGMKLTTIDWMKQDFAECFYTIESITHNQDLKSGKALGKLTWFGKERNETVDIHDSTKRIWSLYRTNDEIKDLSSKFQDDINSFMM